MLFSHAYSQHIAYPSPSDYCYQGKRLLLRLDLNVPLSASGVIQDDTRLRKAVPSIRLFLEYGARLTLCTHLGRPSGPDETRYQLSPISCYLEKHLGIPVPVYPVRDETHYKNDNPLSLLDNIRFLPEEQLNDRQFAEHMAKYIDIYINDAFSVSHRKEMSIDSLCRSITHAYAGPAFLEELIHIQKLMHSPHKPTITLIGGAKLTTKIRLIEKLLSISDHILMGGGLANTLLYHLYQTKIGDSLSQNNIQLSREVIDAVHHGHIILPIDYVVSQSRGEHFIATRDTPLSNGEAIVDIGPQTRKLYAEYINTAKTLFWNGPFGLIEKTPFDEGTHHMALACSQSRAYTIAGGGETLWAIHKAGIEKDIDWLSSGGGALLDLIASGSLPGLEALCTQAHARTLPSHH